MGGDGFCGEAGRPDGSAACHTGLVPSTLPPGDPAPADGSLPPAALAGLGQRPFGLYVHVPFCAVRCGYCDFNTYTAAELGAGVSRENYAGSVIAELRLATAVLAAAPGGVPPVSTVFVGGGTPTLLPAAELVRVLDAVRALFGLASDVEVTTEANPDSVDVPSLEALRAGGSLGSPTACSRPYRRCWLPSTAPMTRRTCHARWSRPGRRASSRSAST